MSEIGPMLNDDDFAALTFGDRLSLSLALCRGYGLTVWALVMAGGLVWGFLVLSCFAWLGLSQEFLIGLATGSVMPESASEQIIRLLMLGAVSGLVMQLLLIGLNSLALFHIDNRTPPSAVAVVLSPWARLGPIFMCLLLWLGVSLLFQSMVGLFAQIPGLGLLIELILTSAYYIVSNCAMFYIADKVICRAEAPPPVETVIRPLAIVANNPLAWLGALALMLSVYLPLAVIILKGLMAGAPFAALVGLLGLTAASVYTIFLLGVTYRQTLAQYIRMRPTLP